MAQFEQLIDGVWSPITGDFVVEEVQYPENNLVIWAQTPGALAAYGIREITAAPAPTPTLAERKVTRLRELAERRWVAEEAGTTVNGSKLATDRETQGKITAMYVRAKENPSYQKRYKGADGSFVTMYANTIIAVANAIEAHVTACFNKEDALTTQINGSSNPEAIDIESGWPS